MHALELRAVQEEVCLKAFANFIQKSSKGIEDQEEYQKVSWMCVLPELNKILRFLLDFKKIRLDLDVIAEYLLIMSSICCHSKTKIGWIFQNLNSSGGHFLIIIWWCLIKVCQSYFICDVDVQHCHQSNWK